MSTLTRSSWGLDRGEAWQNKAACGGQDPAMWETPSGALGPGRAELARRAMAICRTCPVRAECHADAENAPPLGMIRAGIPYTEAGNPTKTCIVCGRYILSSRPNSIYCESHDRYALIVTTAVA